MTTSGLHFRKLPLVIQAFQMTKARRASNFDWPQWLHEAWQKPAHDEGALWPSKERDSDGNDPLRLGTMEGPLDIDWNDWIIKGVNGELYPCKPDIFRKSYEPMHFGAFPSPDRAMANGVMVVRGDDGSILMRIEIGPIGFSEKAQKENPDLVAAISALMKDYMTRSVAPELERQLKALLR
jgi:hypothetical protein